MLKLVECFEIWADWTDLPTGAEIVYNSGDFEYQMTRSCPIQSPDRVTPKWCWTEHFERVSNASVEFLSDSRPLFTDGADRWRWRPFEEDARKTDTLQRVFVTSDVLLAGVSFSAASIGHAPFGYRWPRPSLEHFLSFFGSQAALCECVISN